MPGPGGGARGGGFGRGGHGGGFGGRPGGFYGGYYRRRGFGFFGGGLLSAILFPVFFGIISLVLLISSVFETVGIISQGGIVVYDEEAFQDYSIQEYNRYFTDAKTYEDNILITFLTHEDNSQYFCIAIVGDNLRADINESFGNSQTAFGRAITTSVGENYKYSLSANLASAIDKMTSQIDSIEESSPFKQEHDMSGKKSSSLVNNTDLQINSETVEVSLNAFTEKTGIPAVIVVESAEAVFGKTVPIKNIIILIGLLAVIAICTVVIVKKIRERRRIKKDLELD